MYKKLKVFLSLSLTAFETRDPQLRLIRENILKQIKLIFSGTFSGHHPSLEGRGKEGVHGGAQTPAMFGPGTHALTHLFCEHDVTHMHVAVCVSGSLAFTKAMKHFIGAVSCI
jgi:hypothetical protein